MDITQVVNQLKSNPAILAKYHNLTSVDGILAQAKADGYDLSEADVKNIIASLSERPHGELSEADLVSVAGGDEDIEANKGCPGLYGREHSWEKLDSTHFRCKYCGQTWSRPKIL